MIELAAESDWKYTAMFVPPAEGKTHWTTKIATFTCKLMFSIGEESNEEIVLEIPGGDVIDALPQS